MVTDQLLSLRTPPIGDIGRSPTKDKTLTNPYHSNQAFTKFVNNKTFSNMRKLRPMPNKTIQNCTVFLPNTSSISYIRPFIDTCS